jgi:predicted GH43/DUF377 family glycosyl hydrolase
MRLGRLSRLMLLGMGGASRLSSIWNPLGTILDATAADEEGQIQEPTVIYETGAQVIVTAEPVFKMWYSGGYTDTGIYYAESLDGLNWTKHPANPILATHMRSFVFKNGAQYIMYAHPANGLDKLTSADGITWAVANADVLHGGAPGAWDAGGVQNIFVWIEDGTWYILYEASDDPPTHYQIGLATSPDGVTWTKNAGNPVIPHAGSTSSAHVEKIAGIYYAWIHITTAGMLPTDFAKFHSTDLVNWTRDPAGLAYWRTAGDEGVDFAAGQVADPCLLEVNGQTWMFYTAMSDGSQPTAHINVARANYPIDRVARSLEGISPLYYPQIFQNCSFERAGAGGADVFWWWSEAAGTGVIERGAGAGEFHAGSYGIAAAKLTAGATKNTNLNCSVTFTGGATYRFSGWARGDGVNGGRIRVWNGTDGDLLIDGASFPTVNGSADYVGFSYDFTIPATRASTVYLYCPNAPGAIAYFDDVSLKRVA